MLKKVIDISEKAIWVSRHISIARISVYIAVSTLAAVALTPSQVTNAASLYDNVIQTSNQLLIRNGGGTMDISQNWRSILAECNPTASISLEDTIQSQGHWLVINESVGSSSPNAYILWSLDSTTSTNFYLDSGTEPTWGLSSGTYNVARIYHTNTSSLSCSDYYPGISYGSTTALIALSYSSQLPLLLSTFPSTSTPGYEGSNIPTGPNISPITGSIECFNNDTQITSASITPSSGIAGNAKLSGSGSSKTYTYYPSEVSSTYRLTVECGGVMQTTSPLDISTSTTNSTWYCSVVVQSTCYPI